MGDATEARAIARAAGELETDEWDRTPGDGEFVALQWKHNLGQGAQVDTNVASEKADALKQIALSAADAVGVRFCSADVIEVENEGLMIMELNGGVMMDSLIGQLGDAGVAQASRIYETAVLRALGVDGPAAKKM